MLPNAGTLPIPWKHDQATYQMRYVFAYAMDGTDLPCYILWPIRTEGVLMHGKVIGFGIKQFFDAFS